MAYKTVVIAGTHERENGFSYPVLDLLLQKYGVANPQEFEGEDGARKAQVWDVSNNLALAKIIKTGPLSQQYVTQMSSRDRLKQIMDLALSWSPRSFYEPAHTYKGIPQWTSVHEKAIKATGADFYIDLHSNHSFTEGLLGTSMHINAHADTRLHPLISESLQKAQADQPLVYGTGKKDFPFSASQRERRRALAQEQVITELESIITADGQIDLLNTDPVKLDSKHMRQLRILVQDAAADVSARMERDVVTNWGNEWYFTRFGEKQVAIPSYFLFEAIAWGEEQQKATANFISDYLIQTL